MSMHKFEVGDRVKIGNGEASQSVRIVGCAHANDGTTESPEGSLVYTVKYVDGTRENVLETDILDE